MEKAEVQYLHVLNPGSLAPLDQKERQRNVIFYLKILKILKGGTYKS